MSGPSSEGPKKFKWACWGGGFKHRPRSGSSVGFFPGRRGLSETDLKGRGCYGVRLCIWSFLRPTVRSKRCLKSIRALKSHPTRPSTSTTLMRRLSSMVPTSTSLNPLPAQLRSFFFPSLTVFLFVIECRVKEVVERSFLPVREDTGGVSIQDPQAQRSSLGCVRGRLVCFQCA